ncbi:methyl-accepting chemotaxis protein [Limnoglobus roseus]|uniref:Methyl-accepting chemotaxis protein n=1 Tax=Limnoglobus roseus TaxID=2598579 RepID=A0A5C1AB67_9BACT|nr:CHASE3 domain-containing protein [Limnoglobus roseus]QEL16619.1 methyl-accepting chemotaxis protein [Limnoglobus roseus]
MGTKWTVGRKLAAGFAVALTALLVVGAVSYRSMSQLIENAAWVAHTHEVLQELESLLSLLKDAETGQRGYLISRQKSFLEPYTVALTRYPDRFREIRKLTSDNPNQQRRLDTLEPLLVARVDVLRANIEKQDKDEKVTIDLSRGKQLMDDIRRVVQDMEAEERDLLDRRVADEAESVRIAKLVIVLGSLVAVVLVAVIGVVITRGITGPLRTVTDLSRRVAEGDLRDETLTITSSDEIAQLAGTADRMLKSLRDLTGRISSVTATLGGAAAEILASVQQQAAGTKEQAATVQEITTTMEEISQSGAQISGKAKQVAAAAEAASAASASGSRAVQEMSRGMAAIREQVEEVAENIVGVSEKTQAVGEIIATVNDIAERSNLLALNAAIEAAGAGDHGSRFSVVADEMKNLADQAKDSTVQVRTILGEIQKGINTSVMLTEEAVKRVEAGKQQADVTEQTIRQLAETTVESVRAFEQIVGAGGQQQIGFEQVAQGMRDIRQAASQTAASTTQLEAAAANLTALGRALNEAVGRYKL